MKEILQVMRDLREAGVEMLTIGQYLAPSAHHLPVLRYVTPETFDGYEAQARALGLRTAACAPLVRKLVPRGSAGASRRSRRQEHR